MADRNIYESTEQFNDASMTEDRSNATGRVLDIQKKRVTATVQSGDTLGSVRWRGWDGTNYIEAAKIVVTVDGAPGTNDMPTRLAIFTTVDGASTSTELTRWNNAGQLLHSMSAPNWAPAVPPNGSIGAWFGLGAGLHQQTANAAGARFAFVKQRGAGTASNGDSMGGIDWNAHNGTNVQRGAYIQATVNGVPSSTSMPTALLLGTTPAGSNTTRDVLKVDSNGDLVTMAAGRYINDGLGSQDTRFLLYGGLGTTKAASLNFSNTFDSQGTFSIQRRTTGDAFETNIFGVNLSTACTWIGSGTIPAANPYTSAQLFIASGFGVQQNWASADVNGPGYVFSKSRAGGAVSNGDITGDILFRGFDGTNYISSALIRANIDSTPGTNDMPGAITFWTTADGASSLTQRMALKSDGSLLINTNTVSYGAYLVVNGHSSMASCHFFGGTADAVITFEGQGGYISWNRHGGVGATEFINHKGGGVGGWYWTNTDGTTFTDLAILNQNGEFKATNYGTALTDKGVVGGSVTLNWATGTMVQRFQTTSATNCTISFTAPTNPCALYIKMVAPASGTTPTLTWPTHKGTALPTSITLGKTRMAHILYDGANYVVLNLTPEY